MNQIELSAILFYADFLSLKAVSLPVTDNCKYFYIHGTPTNSAFILNYEPEYDPENPYFLLAMAEYSFIRDKFGEEGLESFVDDICCVKACGSVDAHRMLKCIHLYSSKKERKLAFNTYNTWKNNKIYSHITLDENGDPQETRCTRYVYYAEKMLGRPVVARSVRNN